MAGQIVHPYSVWSFQWVMDRLSTNRVTNYVLQGDTAPIYCYTAGPCSIPRADYHPSFAGTGYGVGDGASGVSGGFMPRCAGDSAGRPDMNQRTPPVVGTAHCAIAAEPMTSRPRRCDGLLH